VRKSLVLLKHENNVLPVRADATVLVSGAAAHDMGVQTGGWTLSWQGSERHKCLYPAVVQLGQDL
ncbi:MAG: hypothetical protein AAFX46_16110, partial [Cyanobacteria bacterium J06636_27]